MTAEQRVWMAMACLLLRRWVLATYADEDQSETDDDSAGAASLEKQT